MRSGGADTDFLAEPPFPPSPPSAKNRPKPLPPVPPPPPMDWADTAGDRSLVVVMAPLEVTETWPPAPALPPEALKLIRE